MRKSAASVLKRSIVIFLALALCPQSLLISKLKKDGNPIGGVAILTGEEPNLIHVAVRLHWVRYSSARLNAIHRSMCIEKLRA